MSDRSVTVFVTHECELCPLVRHWLRGHRVPFIEVDVGTDPSAASRLKRLAGSPVVPSVQLPGGELLVEPSPADLATFLARKVA